MFKNLNHALRWTYDVLARDITGYSNTAAIMRLGEQCGASASTSPDDLTIQEQKAQAVWIRQIAWLSVNEICWTIINLKYGHESLACAYNLASLFGDDSDVNMKCDIVCNIFKFSDDEYKMKRIADRYNKHEPTIYRLRRKLEKDFEPYLFHAEKTIEDALIEKGLINRLT